MPQNTASNSFHKIAVSLALMTGIFLSLVTSQIVFAQYAAAGVIKQQAGGKWSTNNGDGTYRVVVVARGTEHVKHFVYLQWVSLPNPRTKRADVFRSVELGQINQGFYYVQNVRKRASALNRFSVQIMTEQRGGPKYIFNVTMRTAGRYSVRRIKGRR